MENRIIKVTRKLANNEFLSVILIVLNFLCTVRSSDIQITPVIVTLSMQMIIGSRGIVVDCNVSFTVINWAKIVNSSRSATGILAIFYIYLWTVLMVHYCNTMIYYSFLILTDLITWQSVLNGWKFFKYRQIYIWQYLLERIWNNLMDVLPTGIAYSWKEVYRTNCKEPEAPGQCTKSSERWALSRKMFRKINLRIFYSRSIRKE